MSFEVTRLYVPGVSRFSFSSNGLHCFFIDHVWEEPLGKQTTAPPYSSLHWYGSFSSLLDLYRHYTALTKGFNHMYETCIDITSGPMLSGTSPDSRETGLHHFTIRNGKSRTLANLELQAGLERLNESWQFATLASQSLAVKGVWKTPAVSLICDRLNWAGFRMRIPCAMLPKEALADCILASRPKTCAFEARTAEPRYARWSLSRAELMLALDEIEEHWWLPVESHLQRAS